MTGEGNDRLVALLLHLPKSWNDRLTRLMKKQGKIKKATVENLIISFIKKEEERIRAEEENEIGE